MLRLWSRNSLAARIAIGSAFFGLLITGGAIVIGFSALSQQLDERSAGELKGKRDLLLHVLSEISSPEAINQNRHRFGDLLIGHDDLHLALIDPANGLMVTSFSKIAQQSVPALDAKPDSATADYDWTASSAEKLTAVRGIGLVMNGSPVRYYLSMDRRHDSELLAGFIKATWVGLPILLLIVALGAWLIARTSLAPLLRFNYLAASIGTQSLNHRVSLDGLPTELSELATEFNDMLQRVDDGYRRLQDFSGELAHEMRTPVATLMGRTQVALSHSRTMEQLREVLEGNEEELERLSRLISDMLFIAHADHNETILQSEKLDLAVEVQQVAEYLSLIAEERGITIEVTGRAILMGDRRLVQRAITNLLSNAIRHSTENSPVSVMISEQNGEVSLEVANTGDGIPQVHLDRIFDRFYRVDSARARLDGGTGLGLAIVHSIMSAHQGQVTVSSVLGGITRFRLLFYAA
ncbi:sensor protein CzcS [Comamonadaceae bacterium OS-1]|nr:sensor protein CzcS [Comamonadaceae bacterium OS-1]